ncbi:MAG: hypothetical protein ACLPG5_08715 [Acidocella sp.]
MSDPRQNANRALERLTEQFVTDVVNATDSELLAEAKEEGRDLEVEAARSRDILAKALASVGKQKLAAARSALDARSKSASYTTRQLSPQQARTVLENALRDAPETATKLTLAARKGQGLSDADVYGMLEDLADLGILPSGGTDEK